MPEKQVSFAADIAGELNTYRGQMMWRLDLTNYEDVKANSAIILSMIQPPTQMPPPPFPPFSADFIASFTTWTKQRCPP